MRKIPGIFRICPYGFTSYSFAYGSTKLVVTGVVAHPRFGDTKETARAKQFPSVRVTRHSVLADVKFYNAVSDSLVEIEKSAREQLPQALHELRKLNALVKANAEKLGGNDADVQEVRDIAGSAELMSNIFDVIEALANIEGLNALKLDEFIAVYDLAFKAKKIFQSRAKIKPIHIHVSGDGGLGIVGSKKTFPLVLTVLLENAIKYGTVNSTIEIRVSSEDRWCLLEISNRSGVPIDEKRCFERGARFADDRVEGDGLGLYLAHEIVKSHRGSIECRKEEDLVTMTVRVPLHAARNGRG